MIILTGREEVSTDVLPETIESLSRGLWLSRLQREPGIDHRVLRQLFLEGASDDRLLMAVPNSLDQYLHRDSSQNRLAQPPDREVVEKYWKMGIRAVPADHPGYPEQLREIDTFPLVLFWRGTRPDILGPAFHAVTIIGTRTPTAYGIMVTRQITADLARPNVTVISGLARGIDGLAHRTTLENKGLTVAVVAHGVDRVYPPEHAVLMEQIVAQGLVISEHPPGIPALRQYFPARNRILSGLADSVAIMEASRESGTMITADFAADQNRDVYAVPGSIISKNSQGCNQLIKEGAYFLEKADDILCNPSWRVRIARQAMSEKKAASSTASSQTSAPAESLFSTQTSDQTSLKTSARSSAQAASPALKTAFSSTAQALPDIQDRCWLALFGGQPLTLSEAAKQMECGVSEAAAWLSIQEINGLIRNDRGRYALTESGYSCI